MEIVIELVNTLNLNREGEVHDQNGFKNGNVVRKASTPLDATP